MSDNPADTPKDMESTAEDAPPEESGDGLSHEAGPAPDNGMPSSGDDLPDAKTAPAATEEQNAGPQLGQDCDDLQAELSSLSDRHLRLAAEFTNYRRRAETEQSESWMRGQADLLRNFLDGLDDLQRVGAWQAESTTVEALVEGVDLVERKFRQALELAGVEVIDPTGVKFDPNVMEAMMSVPTESLDDDQKVQDVFQKGYHFKGHLVRPARVSVFNYE